MTRADEAQRRRLNETFAELCRVPSPFGHERACADRVVKCFTEITADDLLALLE